MAYRVPFNNVNNPIEPSNVAAVVRPQFRVTFSTSGNIFSFDAGPSDPNSAIVSLQTTKQLSGGTLGGQWSVTLMPSAIKGSLTWKDTINAMDVAVIEMKGDAADPWEVVMVGFVDSVSENMTMQSSYNGATSPQWQITIQGRDFGKILDVSNSWFFPVADTNVLANTGGDLKGSVSHAVYGWAEPDMQQAPIVTVGPNAWYPVVQTIPNWVQLALPNGDTWVPANEVQLHDITSDPVFQTILNFFNAFAYNTELLGGQNSLSVSQLTDLLLTQSGLGSLAPAALTSDSATLIGVLMLTWVYQTMNVPVSYVTSTGHFEQARLADTFPFICGSTNGLIVPNSLFSPQQGSIAGFMQSIQLPPFYELWVDTRAVADYQPGGSIYNLCSPVEMSWEMVQGAIINAGVAADLKPIYTPAELVTFGTDIPSTPILIFRHTPYDAETWTQIPAHTITESDIISKQLTKSDTDTVNVYFSYPDTPNVSSSNPATFTTAYGVWYSPMMDLASIARYGMRVLNTPVDAFPSTNSGTFAHSQFGQLNQELWQWYQNNPFFWSGTYQLGRGRPDMRVGDRLYDASTGMDFYIEEVEHYFTLYQSFTTSVVVSRGEVRSGQGQSTLSATGGNV